MKISVLITTKNRPTGLKRCLDSILNNNSKNKFEVLVIDQSDDEKSKLLVKSYEFSNLKYRRCGKGGLSEELNMAIKKTNSKYLAVSNDDCIVSKSWLKNAVDFLEKNKNLAAVFGNVRPYKKHVHKGYVCPETFTDKRQVFLDNPDVIDYVMAGSANNMIWHKNILEEICGFRDTLGMKEGLVDIDCRDLMLRALIKKYRIAFNSDIWVWHNHWIRKRDFELENGYKTRLRVLMGHRFASKRLGYHQKLIKKSIVYLIKEILYWSWDVFNYGYGLILKLWYRVTGLI